MKIFDGVIAPILLYGSEVMFTSLVLFVYILAFVTGVPSNMFAFYTFWTKIRQKPSPVNIFLLNLTVSDLILLFFLPFKMVEAATNMTWPMPRFLCPIVVIAYFCSIYISTLFLTAVSVERYLGVAYPLKYKVTRKATYAILACTFIWVFSVLQGSIPVIIVHYLSNNESHQGLCYQRFSEEQRKLIMPWRLGGSIGFFWLPFLITIFCYVNFVRLMLAMPKIRGRRKHRAICLAVTTLCNFTVCFAPYNISHIVGFIQNKNPRWRVYALLLSTLNASIDPIIFYYSSTAVQRAFINFLQAIKHKLNIGVPTEGQIELSQILKTVGDGMGHNPAMEGIGKSFSMLNNADQCTSCAMYALLEQPFEGAYCCARCVCIAHLEAQILEVRKQLATQRSIDIRKPGK
ncbi:free fatty acid receptor 2-like [Gastrophryne carolinensis]